MAAHLRAAISFSRSTKLEKISGLTPMLWCGIIYLTQIGYLSRIISFLLHRVCRCSIVTHLLYMTPSGTLIWAALGKSAAAHSKISAEAGWNQLLIQKWGQGSRVQIPLSGPQGVYSTSWMFVYIGKRSSSSELLRFLYVFLVLLLTNLM